MSDNTLEAVSGDTSNPTEDVKQEVEAGSEPVESEKPEETPASEGEPEGDNAEDGKDAKGDSEDKPLSKTERLHQTYQKRINRQTAIRKALEEKVATLEAERENFPAKEVKPAPRLEDFETMEEYTDALADHKAEQRVKDQLEARKQEELKVAREQRDAELKRHYQAKANEFRSKTPDYDEVSKDFAETIDVLQKQAEQRGVNLDTMDKLGTALLKSEHGAEMVYHIGQNPEVLESMATMDVFDAAVEFVKLEQGFQNQSPTDNVAPPKPIKPVKSKGRLTKAVSAKSSPDDIMKWLNSN